MQKLSLSNNDWERRWTGHEPPLSHPVKNTCSSDHGCELSVIQHSACSWVCAGHGLTHSNKSWLTRFTGRSFTLLVEAYTGSRTVKVKGSSGALQKAAG